MIRESKLQGYIERINGVKRPITADIFLTDYCNEKCAYCRYAHKTGKYMKFEDFVKYSERLIELGVQSFILTGGGEPTINPDFKKITDYLEGKGIPYGINTNMQVLRKCNPVFMKISIDTGDSERYKALIPQHKFLQELQVSEKQSSQNTWICQKFHLSWCCEHNK